MIQRNQTLFCKDQFKGRREADLYPNEKESVKHYNSGDPNPEEQL
jgi:hypothetical protein